MLATINDKLIVLHAEDDGRNNVDEGLRTTE
jgi:hypothetical protein